MRLQRPADRPGEVEKQHVCVVSTTAPVGMLISVELVWVRPAEEPSWLRSRTT